MENKTEYLSDYELYQVLEANNYKTTEKNLSILKEGLESGKYELQPKDLNEASTAQKRYASYVNGTGDYSGKGAKQAYNLYAGKTYARELSIIKKNHGSSFANKWKEANPPTGSVEGRMSVNAQAAKTSMNKKANSINRKIIEKK